jgi:hypothetical protein
MERERLSATLPKPSEVNIGSQLTMKNLNLEDSKLPEASILNIATNSCKTEQAKVETMFKLKTPSEPIKAEQLKDQCQNLRIKHQSPSLDRKKQQSL